ncbi:hypothetical protein U1Q18_045121 [Sarracenia purpurea var. burkii]
MCLLCCLLNQESTPRPHRIIARTFFFALKPATPARSIVPVVVTVFSLLKVSLATEASTLTPLSMVRGAISLCLRFASSLTGDHNLQDKSRRNQWKSTIPSPSFQKLFAHCL